MLAVLAMYILACSLIFAGAIYMGVFPGGGLYRFCYTLQYLQYSVLPLCTSFGHAVSA